jgi:hypothetical protein
MPDSQNAFVLLAYAPDGRTVGARSIPVLVLQRGPTVEVLLPPKWDAGMGLGSREYLSELIRDWEGGSDADSLIRELSELSVGPLRTVETGVLAPGKREALSAQISAGG